MMHPITVNELHTHLGEYRITRTEIKKILKTVSFDDFYNVYKNTLSCVLWNRTDPVNGIPADRVLASRLDVTDKHKVALIKDGNQKVLYFQPMLASESTDKLEEMMEQIACSHANSAVLNRVTELLVAGYWNRDAFESQIERNLNGSID